jgi:hypothetical protein
VFEVDFSTSLSESATAAAVAMEQQYGQRRHLCCSPLEASHVDSWTQPVPGRVERRAFVAAAQMAAAPDDDCRRGGWPCLPRVAGRIRQLVPCWLTAQFADPGPATPRSRWLRVVSRTARFRGRRDDRAERACFEALTTGAVSRTPG